MINKKLDELSSKISKKVVVQNVDFARKVNLFLDIKCMLDIFVYLKEKIDIVFGLTSKIGLLLMLTSYFLCKGKGSYFHRLNLVQ